MPCTVLRCSALLSSAKGKDEKSCAVLYCTVLRCPAMPCFVLRCIAMSCFVLPCLAQSGHGGERAVVLCDALPCHVVPCRALCCSALLSPATGKNERSCRVM